MNNRNIFFGVASAIGVVWLLALVLVFSLVLCGCSSSRKVAEESHVAILSDSSFSVATEDYKEALTEYSEKGASLAADSIVIYPRRIAPESSEPPDSQPKVYPAFAASLYGVKLDISNADSSSLLFSASASKSSSSSSVSAGSDSSKADTEVVKEQGSSCLWGVVFFMFLVLAGVMSLRYCSK